MGVATPTPTHLEERDVVMSECKYNSFFSSPSSLSLLPSSWVPPISPTLSLPYCSPSFLPSPTLQPRRGILRHSESPAHSPKSSQSHPHKSSTLPSSSSPGSKRRNTSPSLTRRTQPPSYPRSVSPNLRKTYQLLAKTSPLTQRKMISASGSLMGSGEFDRLEPRLDSDGTAGSHGYSDGMMRSPNVHPYLSPGETFSWSPTDGEFSSLDRRGMAR